VRDAGKFDGALGVVLAIASVARLHEEKRFLPFAIEIIGFADEEGARFQTTYLGSRAVAGNFDPTDLARCDANGVTLAEAIREFGGDPRILDEVERGRLVRVNSTCPQRADEASALHSGEAAAGIASCKMRPQDLLGYIEIHIEQGPVLENRNEPLGIVSAIAGQTRASVDFQGRAGHAGTTPMDLRRDALCAAAEFVLAVERKARDESGLVATVGQITAEPNASNVICGAVHLTLDVRHQNDSTRTTIVDNLRRTAVDIAKRRDLQSSWLAIQETASVECSGEWSRFLRQAARLHQPEIIDLPSGAGHDAAVMARITRVAMLFVRCRAGISHHPDESVQAADLALAVSTLDSFLELLAARV